MVLLATFAHAGTSAASFATDAGEWLGGTVSGGVLALTNEESTFVADSITSFTVTARVRVTSGTAISFSAGDATFSATYGPGGALSLGESRAPFAVSELSFVSDAGPVLVPGTGEIEIRDPEIIAFNSTYFLYYTAIDDTGAASVRLATSTDMATFTHVDTAILTDASAPAAEVDGTTISLAFARSGSVRFAGSADGFVATESITSLGAGSDFDADGLDAPALVIADGVHRLWYNALTSGQTGYATSADGTTYTRESALTDDSDRLFGLDVGSGVFGLEAIYTMGDSLGYTLGGVDPTFSAESNDIRPLVSTNDAAWADGGFGSPSLLRVGEQLYVYVAAVDEGQAVIGRFVGEPSPGSWATLSFTWDGTTATAQWNDGPALTTVLSAVDTLAFIASGTAEIDEVTVSYSSASDTGAIDSGEPSDTATLDTAVVDTGTPVDSAALDTAGGMNAGEWLGDPGGCGCNQGVPAAPMVLSLVGTAALLNRRRRSTSQQGNRPC